MKILQISAAPPGWRAAFADGDDHDAQYLFEAINCWLLIEREGETQVVGMSGSGKLRICDEDPQFLGYQEPARPGDDDMIDWRVRAREFFLERLKQESHE